MKDSATLLGLGQSAVVLPKKQITNRGAGKMSLGDKSMESRDSDKDYGVDFWVGIFDNIDLLASKLNDGGLEGDFTELFQLLKDLPFQFRNECQHTRSGNAALAEKILEVVKKIQLRIPPCFQANELSGLIEDSLSKISLISRLDPKLDTKHLWGQNLLFAHTNQKSA